jgi:hypothetical protein
MFSPSEADTDIVLLKEEQVKLEEHFSNHFAMLQNRGGSVFELGVHFLQTYVAWWNADVLDKLYGEPKNKAYRDDLKRELDHRLKRVKESEETLHVIQEQIGALQSPRWYIDDSLIIRNTLQTFADGFAEATQPVQSVFPH